MLKSAALLFFSLSLLCATKNIDTKIDTTNKKLNNYEAKYKNVHKRLAKSAKDILETQKKVYTLDRELQKLSNELQDTKGQYDATKEEISKLQAKKETLTEHKESMRKELSRLMAKQLSLKIILNQHAFNDTNALIRSEVFTAISRLTKQELEKIKENITGVLKDENDLSAKIDGLSTMIASVDHKRQDVLSIKQRHQEILTNLNTKRSSYKKDLENTLSSTANLRKTLRQLKIIKEDQEKEAAREAKERAELAKQRAQKDTKNINDTHVKHGDLYENVKTTRYRGSKTIAPLSGYKVIKKFGPYQDPIYNIKIFNESVSLKPSQSNASVRSVLNGKVILAKKTPLLGYFVIIEHNQGIHTIYAHLDKIAPTLKQGKRIKKGNVIGRVNDELMFEVTQKNYHINPLELIR